MTNPIHNLDENIIEYFDFIIKGHTYRFKQPNTEEMTELQQSSADNEKSKNTLFRFITAVSDGAPEFSEIQKIMTVPHWQAFNKMIRQEMGLDDSNTTAKSS